MIYYFYLPFWFLAFFFICRIKWSMFVVDAVICSSGMFTHMHTTNSAHIFWMHEIESYILLFLLKKNIQKKGRQNGWEIMTNYNAYWRLISKFEKFGHFSFWSNKSVYQIALTNLWQKRATWTLSNRCHRYGKMGRENSQTSKIEL